MRNLLTFIIILLTITCVSCKWDFKKLPMDKHVITSIELKDAFTKQSPPDQPTGLVQLDSIFKYELHLTNLSSNSDTTITVTRKYRYNTSKYIGETVVIHNNEIYYVGD